MVRLSNTDDIPGIITLWKEAFGDTKEDICFFLDAHFKPENTVVNDFDEKITSVLFLLDGFMHINDCDYPSYYLYAACTLKEYRGRGQMAELLDFATKTAQNRKKYFICLKPAEESLFDYYSRFGYKTFFYKKTALFNCEELKENEKNISESSNISLSDIRNSFLLNFNYFKWDEHSVNYAAKQNEYYGGYTFKSCKGYILYSVDKDVLTVKENTFTSDLFIDAIKTITQKHCLQNIKADFPFGFDMSDMIFETSRSGMILPLNAQADSLINSVDNAYLGLTLD